MIRKLIVRILTIVTFIIIRQRKAFCQKISFKNHKTSRGKSSIIDHRQKRNIPYIEKEIVSKDKEGKNHDINTVKIYYCDRRYRIYE